MSDKTPYSSVYIPQSTAQALQYLRKKPAALVYAGGTELLLQRKAGDFSFPPDVIYLGKAADLERITRTERYLEIGACAPLNQIIDIGRTILPEALYLCLKQIGSYTLRNRATIGGNLCVRHQRMDAYPVLLIMDVRLEVRKLGSARWIPLNRLFTADNTIILQPGELVTRLRIPLDNWDIQLYRKIGGRTIDPHNSLTFCGLAKLQKGILHDFRFSFGGIKDLVIREKQLEAQIAGKKLPLHPKDIEMMLGDFNTILGEFGNRITAFQKKRAFSLLHWFVDLISDQF